MGRYKIGISDTAKKDLRMIEKSGNKPFKDKIQKIFFELEEHPHTGTGHPEALRYVKGNIWSRRIDKKNRIRYMIQEDIDLVTVISLSGHYDDK